MKILVLMRMVPDIVEELDVGPDGTSLDLEFLRLIVNERDEHALEQALLLKERHDASVVVIAVDAPEVDDLLFTALAKGADRVVKITGAESAAGTAGMAAVVAATLPAIPDAADSDLILTGSRAIDDLDGMTAPLLAAALDLPYTGLLNGVSIEENGIARVLKEFSGGVTGTYDVALPAVLGIQGAEKPPRYVPIAKIRAAMASGAIEEIPAAEAAAAAPPVLVGALAKPEESGRAEMLTGDVEELANTVADLLADRGLV
jgi:electron transfer flavoprotein beta subunit